LHAALDADPTIGGVCPKIIRLNERAAAHLDSTGDFITTWGFAWPRGRDELDEGQWDDPACRWVHAVSGGASLFRCEVFEQVGLFDESFFAYYEDVDLGLRAHRHRWRFAYVPEAVVHHRLEGTSSRLGPFRRHHLLKNMILLAVKNLRWTTLLRHAPTLVLGWVMLAAQTLLMFGPMVLARSLVATWTALPAAVTSRRAHGPGRRLGTGVEPLRGLPPSVAVPWRRPGPGIDSPPRGHGTSSRTTS